MSKTRRSLTPEKRYHIAFYLSKGYSVRSAAREVDCHPSVISREIRRNSVEGRYEVESAQYKAKKRKSAASARPRKLKAELVDLISSKISMQFSPVQTAGWIRQNHAISISHQSIYRLIRADQAYGGKLYTNLRHWKKRRRKRIEAPAGCHLIPGRIDISQRPAIVDDKSRVGDWEADTVIGAKHQGSILTLVERKSKMLLSALLPDKTKASVTNAIIKLLKPYANLVHTITFDNGGEFADHQKVAKKLKAQTFFAKPYSSWQRGLNEHTNGLLRQYFPKKTNFLEISPKQLLKAQNLINIRPRNVLSFHSPQQVFSDALSVAYQT